MKLTTKIPWKISLSVGLGVLCSIALFWALLPSPASVADAKGIEKPHIPAGCHVYQQDFPTRSSVGNRTMMLTKSNGCGGAVWVQFTKLPPYQPNVLVCSSGDLLASGCKSLQGWFTPMQFTNTSPQEVDTVKAGTPFYVTYADYDASPAGSGHIVVYY